jgi:uncharacterized protein
MVNPTLLTPRCQERYRMMLPTTTATTTREEIYMNNALSWFEIPVNDLKRAAEFYGNVIGQSLISETMGPQEMAVFPYNREQGVGGCLISTDYQKPTATGNIIYLQIDNLDAALARAQKVGGKIALNKVELPNDNGGGCFAHIIDSEGNRVGLHMRGQ